MTQLHATKRTALEMNAAEVVAALVAGEAMPTIAKRYGVHTSSVMRFAERHKADIQATTQKLAGAVEDYLIANKVHRIAALDDRWRRLRRVIDERANDDEFADVPGMKTGTMVRTIRMIGSGDNAMAVNEFKVDTGLLAEIRNIEHAAAEELAQLPRAPDANINVNVGLAVQLVWSDGDSA